MDCFLQKFTATAQCLTVHLWMVLRLEIYTWHHMAMLEILSCQKFQKSVSHHFQAQFCRKSQHLQPYGSLWFITNFQLKLHFGVSPSHCFRLAGSPKTTHCARLLCQVSVLRLPRRPGDVWTWGTSHGRSVFCVCFYGGKAATYKHV